MRLSDNGIPKLNVYDYNFACPDVARNFATGWNWLGEHDNIFNIGNVNDPVTMIPGGLGDVFGSISNDMIDMGMVFTGHDVQITESGESTISTPLSNWGKFGKSYWFSEDWDNGDNEFIKFEAHEPKNYVNYLRDHRNDPAGTGEMRTWIGMADKSAVVSGTGVLKLVKAYIGIKLLLMVFCPVDVDVTDSNGNLIASIHGDEIDYHNSEFGDVIIFTQGDEKLIYIGTSDEIDVNLTGTDSGEMKYVIAKSDMLGEETEYISYNEKVRISKNKHFEDHIDLNQVVDGENNSTLKVVNKNGDIIADVQPDGKEQSVKGSFIAQLKDKWWIGLIIVIVLVLVVFIIFLSVRNSTSSNSRGRGRRGNSISRGRNVSGGRNISSQRINRGSGRHNQRSSSRDRNRNRRR